MGSFCIAESRAVVQELLLEMPMKRVEWFLVAVLCLASLCPAAEWFVAPGNAPGGNGSKLQPWQLQVAFTNISLVKAGDTLWLRTGTYSNLYTIKLNGMSNAPIIIRNYNRERAIIDGAIISSTSSNVWLWGLEVTDSNKTNRSNPFNTISGGRDGMKYINCLIHDCCIGIQAGGDNSFPTEAYGNIMWYCGKSDLEHGLYWQNNGPNIKLIKHNLIGYSHGFGIHFYGSSGKVNNAHVIENAVWGSGALWDGKSDIIMGSAGVPGNDQLIRSNSLYNPGGRALDLGYGQHDTNVVVAGNTIKAAYPMWLRNESTSYIVTNNLMGSFYGPTVLRYFTNLVFGPHVWDYNTYYNTYASYAGSWSNQFAQINGTGTNILFPQWQAKTSFDVHSTFTDSPPAVSRVYVWPNTYEAKRAHLVVWNFGLSNTVPVDLSVVLSAGDNYEIRNAMDYFSPAVVSGRFTGSQINLPLTNLTTATPINDYPFVYPNKANFTTNFAAFVVIGSAVPHLTPPQNPRLGSSPP